MSRVLLDTSAYSAFFRGHPEVKLALQEAESIALNAIVLGELHFGFRGGNQQKKNERELLAFLSSDRVQVLDVTGETAERYAIVLRSLRGQGTPIPTNDIWIAATAMQYGLRLITTDRHFQVVPQIVVDCFNSGRD